MTKSMVTPTPAAREAAPSDAFARLREQAEERLRQFRHSTPTPAAAYALEKELKAVFDGAARAVLQQAFNRLEPDDKSQAAAKVRYRGQTYRINKKTKAQVATSFGPITLWSFLYLCCEDGEPGLHPLHVCLGIGAGLATAVLAER